MTSKFSLDNKIISCVIKNFHECLTLITINLDSTKNISQKLQYMPFESWIHPKVMSNNIHMTMTIWIIKWGDDDFADKLSFCKCSTKNIVLRRKRENLMWKTTKKNWLWDKRDHSAGTKRVLAFNWKFFLLESPVNREIGWGTKKTHFQQF